jgi:hypothetical protein
MNDTGSGPPCYDFNRPVKPPIHSLYKKYQNYSQPSQDGAVKYLPQILSDDDAEVRKSALELSAILFTGCSSTQLAPFLSSLGACCSLVLSHINWLVKLDGLKEKAPYENVQTGYY